MATTKEITIKRGELLHVDPRQITVENGYNVRDRLDNDELMESIKANGVTDPLVIRQDGDKVLLVQGHGRVDAGLRRIAAGENIISVPAITRKMNEEERTLDLFVSNSGLGLEMHEQGRIFKRLIAFGWDAKRIAASTGKTV